MLVTIVFLSFIIIPFIAMSCWSNFFVSPNVGIEEQRLRPCPTSPNCVCSESFADKSHRVEPIILADVQANFVQRAVDVIELMNGQIVVRDANYIHAVFRTPVFLFKDDLELRFTDQNIFLRSSSRVGYSDFGANRRRARIFEQKFSATEF